MLSTQHIQHTKPEAPLTQLALEVPVLTGLVRWQAWAVDRIKRAAIQQLHRTKKGELLLLKIYLIGEESTEQTLQQELVSDPPKWLDKLVAQHLHEEQVHVELFANEMRQLGVEVKTGQPPDRISARKIEKWRQLALQYAPAFKHDVLVPAYAIGMCAEQMAQRVLTRHKEAIGTQHALYPLLCRVLKDEEHHVRMCAYVLQRTVYPQESGKLYELLDKVRQIDRSWGVTGAMGMYAMGVIYRVGQWLIPAKPAAM